MRRTSVTAIAVLHMVLSMLSPGQAADMDQSGTILTVVDGTNMNAVVAAAIQKDIGLKTVKVGVAGDTATLEGSVYDPSDVSMAMEKAKQRCAKVVCLIKLEEVMIETDVCFVMIDTTDKENPGLDILKKLAGNVSNLVNDAGTSFSIATNPMARVNGLAGEGKAEILATPHLSSKSGGTGRFHSGGEIEFAVPGITNGSLEKVEHGVVLTVRSTFRGQDRIISEVTLDVSVPSKKPTETFTIDKYETASTITTKIGESILMSGLSRTLEGKFKNKISLLEDIPILKAFFSEKSRIRETRDIVVIITPQPALPATASKEEPAPAVQPSN